MSLTIDIALPCRRWATAVPGARGLCRRAAQAALAAPGRSGLSAPDDPMELSIVLADDATIRDLNRQFRGKDKATNVLSFPAQDHDAALTGAPVTLGDVVIAFETVVAEAVAEHKSVADHLAHLVVHGVLHLRGYDHERDADAETMESLETAILARLGVADPYETTVLEMAR